MTKRKASASETKREVPDEAVRTFTGWKLDLCRAVRADHKVSPGAASLFAAVMDFVNMETRKAWPSEGGLAIALGVNRKTVRKYLQILISAKWLEIAGRSNRGTTILLVQDYRMNIVLDQLIIDMERFREQEAQRQSSRRAKRAPDVCPHGWTPTDDVSVHTGTDPSVHTGGYEHLHRTPSSQNGYEKRETTEEPQENAYRRASRGW